MLRLSLLIDRITDLVRSNSITDITERINVYAEVIVFARAIADRPDLVALLSTPQFLKITSPGKRSDTCVCCRNLLQALINPIRLIINRSKDNLLAKEILLVRY